MKTTAALFSRQERLTRALAKELAAPQAPGWESISFWAHVVDDRVQSSVSLLREGTPDAVGPPTPRFWELLDTLRAVMARRGRGTWFGMSLSVPAKGRATATFDGDREPLIVPPPSYENFGRDAARFPRDVEHRPAWLRERLSWAALTPAQLERAELGRSHMEVPMYGGTRQLFPVSVVPDDVVVVTDSWTGARAFVAADGTVRVVEGEQRTRPSPGPQPPAPPRGSWPGDAT
jgi:hypothetical protein